MKQELIHGSISMDWLFDTHLKHRTDRKKWKSALIVGNEDCPEEVKLFAKTLPLITDPYELAISNYKVNK